tara:strand:- start:10063 stop:10677 length:615 start_codon:yes stop_codon:yes gene_type:complete
MQDISLNVNPRPSKLYFYQIFYDDLNEYKSKFEKISITEFACGASKILDFIKPNYYQGIDLKKDMITTSQSNDSYRNYDFHVGDMTNFQSKINTNFNFCVQALGINLSFNQDNLMKTLKNLNNHTLKNGVMVFNISTELYTENKETIDKYLTENYEFVEYLYYGMFNERYNNTLTRILVRIEHFLRFTSYLKKYVYIKCLNKKF